MNKDSLTRLAGMFHERNPQRPLSPTTGVVISLPPSPRIRLNEVIVLEPGNLVFAAHLLAGYERGIRFDDSDAGRTTSENDGGQGAGSHAHGIAEIHVDTMMQWTDTLKEGDEVILMPSADGQLYYVIDKGVRF